MTLILVVSSEAFPLCMTKKARKENALDAEWDKRSDVKEKMIEGLRNTKGTR
jgi:hypothetical protein